MRRTFHISLLAVAASIALAGGPVYAEGKNRGSRAEPQTRFGEVFAAAFNASEKAKPIEPTRKALPPVMFKKGPKNF